MSELNKVLQYLNCLMSLDNFLDIQLISSTLVRYLQAGCIFLLYGCRIQNANQLDLVSALDIKYNLYFTE